MSKSKVGGARPGAGRKVTTGRGSAARYVVSVAYSGDEIEAIDRARGEIPRAAWVRQASLERANREPSA